MSISFGAIQNGADQVYQDRQVAAERLYQKKGSQDGPKTSSRVEGVDNSSSSALPTRTSEQFASLPYSKAKPNPVLQELTSRVSERQIDIGKSSRTYQDELNSFYSRSYVPSTTVGSVVSQSYRSQDTSYNSRYGSRQNASRAIRNGAMFDNLEIIGFAKKYEAEVTIITVDPNKVMVNRDGTLNQDAVRNTQTLLPEGVSPKRKITVIYNGVNHYLGAAGTDKNGNIKVKDVSGAGNNCFINAAKVSIAAGKQTPIKDSSQQIRANVGQFLLEDPGIAPWFIQ